MAVQNVIDRFEGRVPKGIVNADVLKVSNSNLNR
jgi:hypothetical protein